MVGSNWSRMAEQVAAEVEFPENGGGSERDALLARQRKETKELRANIQAMKKAVPKGDKKRKKDVTAETAQLEQELQERHERELETLETLGGVEVVGGEGGGDGGEGRESKDKPTKKSRAQKRKEKKVLQEQERQQRREEDEREMAASGNPRLRERMKLEMLLEPLHLAVVDIQPDGNCLYAAITDQLSQRLKIKSSVSQLREQCAGYVRTHSSDFLPFLTDPKTGDLFTEDQFVQYCTEIESTAAWGGQLEIRALSHMYQVPITVYQAESPPVVVGEEYSHSHASLTLSYHHHEYGLGEHYNSLAPICR